MNKITELRFGRPKTGKTKNVCESYPKPLLVLNFDPEGFTAITARKWEKLDTVELRKDLLFKRTLSDVTVVDYAPRINRISLDQYKSPSALPFQRFLTNANDLLDFCPFQTVVVDSYTMMDDKMIDFLLDLDKKKKAEIQMYKFLQDKKLELLQQMLSLQTGAIVVIAHEELIKNEITGEIDTIPFGTGKTQQIIGLLFSSVLHATVVNVQGKIEYKVETVQTPTCKGIGVRGYEVKGVCGARFEDIYETG